MFKLRPLLVLAIANCIKKKARSSSTMTTLFEQMLAPGTADLRMGAPGDKILLRSAEHIKNAAQKVMVSVHAFVYTLSCSLSMLHYQF